MIKNTMSKVKILVIENNNPILKLLKNCEREIDIDVLVKEDKNKLLIIEEDIDLKEKITKILHELGIPSSIKGYTYIKDSISMVYNGEVQMGEITKGLYPIIAEKYHSSIACIEKDIRHAIEVGFNRANTEYIEEIFGYSMDINKAKPTNSEFIITVAENLQTKK